MNKPSRTPCTHAPARHRLCAGILVALVAVATAGTAHAQQDAPPQQIAVEAGSLEDALNQLSRQTRVLISFPPELLQARTAPALSGHLTWREALERLLQGTDLEYAALNERTIVLRQSPVAAEPAPRPAAEPQGPPPAQPEEGVTDIQGMTVTGTRIRGGSTPSPVIAIDALQIEQEGFTDLGEVIRSVPANFSGGQNPGVLMGNVTGAGIANQNVSGGSGLNLRGLGPDASLTLLNGRRMAYGGFVQAVDISAIPLDAVERIEIVADGASAIYGSDAVGGAANVLLKREYDGFALRTRYGGATDGGLTTREYNVTAGATWTAGGLIATYRDSSVDPIYARQRDFTDHLPLASSIHPGIDSHSGLISAHHALGAAVEVRLDAMRSSRDQSYNYHFGTHASYNILTPKTTTSFVSPSVEFRTRNDWLILVGGTWAEDEVDHKHSRLVLESGALTTIIHDCFCNKSRSFDVGAEGALANLPGGELRLAVGGGYRVNEFLQANHLTGVKTVEGDESSRFAYAEFNLPLVGPASDVAGTRRLEATIAIRGEDYRSFGQVVTPKFGLIYAPSNSVTAKVSFGRSFKAPTLYQLYRAHSAQVSPAAFFGGGHLPDDSLVLLNAGGNRDLEPERARTWSATLAFHPESVPGFGAELTWFDIDYTDRVVEPITDWDQTLTSPNYADFVRFSPTAQEQAAIIDAADRFVVTSGATYDPDRVVALIFARYVNAARQRIRGVDVSGSYQVDLDNGTLTLRGSASLLDSSQQTTTHAFDLAGTLYNPAKRASRLGAVWTAGGFTASTFANFIDGITDTRVGRKGGSMTTFDTTLRYATGDREDLWSDMEFDLSMTNVLDRSPPLYTPDMPDFIPPYDSNNYSPIGRHLMLSVSKRW